MMPLQLLQGLSHTVVVQNPKDRQAEDDEEADDEEAATATATAATAGAVTATISYSCEC